MRKFLVSILAVMLLFTLASGSALAIPLPQGAQNGYYGNTQPGYILLEPPKPANEAGTVVGLDNTDRQGVHEGDMVKWSHPNNDTMKLVIGKGIFPDKSTAKVLHYSSTLSSVDNGYMLVAEQDISDWVTALNGNPTYTNNYAERTTMSDYFNTWKVVELYKLAALSGGAVYPYGADNAHAYSVSADGQYAIPTFRIVTTNPPTSSLAPLAKSSYKVGEQVDINATASIETLATSLHFNAFLVTGPNNYRKFLPTTAVTKANSTFWADAKAAESLGFPYYGERSGALAQVSGGGGGPNTPSVYTETSNIDTVGLEPGTYTITYCLYDGVGRPSTSGSAGGSPGSIQQSFTLVPGSSISLSANPDHLTKGNASTLTATPHDAPPGSKVLISDRSEAHTLGGTNLAESATAQATSDTEQTVDYQAFLLNAQDEQIAISNTVSVTWGAPPPPDKPTLTLTGAPTNLPSREYADLKLTYDTEMIAGDLLRIEDETGNPYTTNMIPKGATSHITEDTPVTHTYHGVMKNPKTWTDDVVSNEVTITWFKANEPPVAVITAPEIVKLGDDTPIAGNASYDTDGEILGYSWGFNPWDSSVHNTYHNEWEMVWFERTGTYTVYLTVSDDGGKTGRTSQNITVIEPYPEAKIRFTGTKKENRKVTLDASYSTSPNHYPIDWTKTHWTVTPLSGGAEQDIMYNGLLDGNQIKDTLFKKAGDYRVELTVTNTLGLSDTTSQVLTIAPDLAPTADFLVNKTSFRNPNDGLHATFVLTDQSSSPDSDVIAQRIWKYAYDSDNDGQFDDETWVIIDQTNNKTSLTFRPTEVGRYRFELQVVEGFGQPTLPEFITPSDYRTGKTW